MLNAADLKVTGVITTLTWIRCDISLGSTSYDIPCHSWNECLQGTKTYGIHVHKYIHSYITVCVCVCICTSYTNTNTKQQKFHLQSNL